MDKNNPTEKQIDFDAWSGEIEAWVSVKTHRKV